MINAHLILGGARSGKSAYAERLALATHAQTRIQTQSQPKPSNAQNVASSATQQNPLIYLATGTAGDLEMAARINHHQARREQQNQSQTTHWQTVEEPMNLACALTNITDGSVVLIDCLTLWLSNCLHQECWEIQKADFIDALSASDATIIMVSNEVGSGIVPMGKLSRQFVDQSGWLHQQLAAICSDVTLVVAGLPMKLKPVQNF